MLPRLTGGGFDSHVGGYTTNDESTDASAAQLQVQLSPVKGTPLPLRDDDVTGALLELFGKVRPSGWQLGWSRQRPIYGLLERVRKVSRPGDPCENHRGAGGAEAFRQLCAGARDGPTGAGRQRKSENAILQINQHQRSRARIECIHPIPLVMERRPGAAGFG